MGHSFTPHRCKLEHPLGLQGGRRMHERVLHFSHDTEWTIVGRKNCAHAGTANITTLCHLLKCVPLHIRQFWAPTAQHVPSCIYITIFLSLTSRRLTERIPPARSPKPATQFHFYSTHLDFVNSTQQLSSRKLDQEVELRAASGTWSTRFIATGFSLTHSLLTDSPQSVIWALSLRPVPKRISDGTAFSEITEELSVMCAVSPESVDTKGDTVNAVYDGRLLVLTNTASASSSSLSFLSASTFIFSSLLLNRYKEMWPLLRQCYHYAQFLLEWFQQLLVFDFVAWTTDLILARLPYQHEPLWGSKLL